MHIGQKSTSGSTSSREVYAFDMSAPTDMFKRLHVHESSPYSSLLEMNRHKLYVSPTSTDLNSVEAPEFLSEKIENTDAAMKGDDLFEHTPVFPATTDGTLDQLINIVCSVHKCEPFPPNWSVTDRLCHLENKVTDMKQSMGAMSIISRKLENQYKL